MEHEKSYLATNLTALRKAKKLTQIELAEAMHYSDKSVSKWENGDTVPDIDTLINLSEYYQVSIDDLCKRLITPAEIGQKDSTRTKRHRSFTGNKIIVTALAVVTIWAIATFSYVETLLLENINYWMFFVWAMPISAIISLVFCSIWGKKKHILAAISITVWLFLFSVHMDFFYRGSGHTLWPIYLLGVPVQIAIILSSKLSFTKNHQ